MQTQISSRFLPPFNWYKLRQLFIMRRLAFSISWKLLPVFSLAFIHCFFQAHIFPCPTNLIEVEQFLKSRQFDSFPIHTHPVSSLTIVTRTSVRQFDTKCVTGKKGNFRCTRWPAALLWWTCNLFLATSLCGPFVSGAKFLELFAHSVTHTEWHSIYDAHAIVSRKKWQLKLMAVAVGHKKSTKKALSAPFSLEAEHKLSYFHSNIPNAIDLSMYMELRI